MKAIRNRLVLAGLVAATALGVAGACSSSPTGPGQLRVSMVDAAPFGVDQIVVNVTKVTAHSSSDGWITVSTTPVTVDLLTLQTSPLALGLVKLSAGRITQIRLYVTKDGNWVHVTGDPAGALTPLVVPSGFESGIKIGGPWRVDACERTSVTIDFDGMASLEVHPTGTGSEWILRPVIRFKKTDTSPIACEDHNTGGTCDSETPCDEGQVCVNGKCAPAQSGGGAGSSCSGGGDCLSESCVDGKCAQSPPSGPCRSNDDCTNHVCQDDGSCAPCTKDTECPVGFICTGGTCTSNL
jgi:Domain of unknown function (DUF4382)